MNLQWRSLKSIMRRECIDKTQGTTAIEFAIVAPVFLLIFMGIFEVGSVMYVRSALEMAVFQVSRFGRTGDTVGGLPQADTAKELFTKYTYGLVDANKVILTVTPYSSFAAVPTNSQVLAQGLNNGNQNFGGSNAIVLYTLSYNWTFYTPLLGKLLSSSGNGKVMLMSSAVIQNEPF